MIQDAGIIEDMKKLGFSEYEVKAYLKLLEEYPVNGYTLSKNSGIPRSRIYEVLESLKTKQVVFEQLNEKATLYYPLEPRLLVEKLRNGFDAILNEVDKYTQKLYSKEQKTNELLIIKGRDNIVEFLQLQIKDAKKRIAVSIWEEEVHDLTDFIQAAIDRGVVLRGIYFGKNNSFKELTAHRRIERYLSERKERYMTIVIDSEQVIAGIVSRGEESQATWTKDKGFVEMSEDYISHDLMVNAYSNMLEEEERVKYEGYLDTIRKEYFGFSEDEFEGFR